MDEGSIEGITARLKSWGTRYDRGFARVEWDSMDSRREVVTRLKHSLSDVVPLVEIELSPGGDPQETAWSLITQLEALGNAVVSITGIEWAFPKDGKLLDTLVALSFQRETLAKLPVRQIWWIPSGFSKLFFSRRSLNTPPSSVSSGKVRSLYSASTPRKSSITLSVNRGPASVRRA